MVATLFLYFLEHKWSLTYLKAVMNFTEMESKVGTPLRAK